MTSIAFFTRYPSPSVLEGTSHAELTKFLLKSSKGRVGAGKPASDRARIILDSLQDTAVPYQGMRDRAVRSALRQIRANIDGIKDIEGDIVEFMGCFECTLTTMSGIDVVTAAQLLACIGDIRRFSTPAKLARYSGIAPVTYASGKSEVRYANRRGNRELNSIIHLLSVRLISAPRNRIINQFFQGYYKKKVSEGKTKRQALKCVQRRLVNIIWAMLTHGREYVNPPVVDKLLDE
jgi:transposase